ncbi:hypothetical protein J2W15_001881 [Pseudarthrobacter sulfonivorans]|nr:hypothetical protein [Pseudarthrobacter sulfonivorans]
MASITTVVTCSRSKTSLSSRICLVVAPQVVTVEV